METLGLAVAFAFYIIGVIVGEINGRYTLKKKLKEGLTPYITASGRLEWKE